MGHFNFTLRSLVTLWFVVPIGSASPAAGGQSLVSPGTQPGLDGSSSGVPNATASTEPSENWYRFFCGPGWDSSVLVPCGIHGNGAPFRGCGNSADPEGAGFIVESGDAGADDVVLFAYGERPGALSIVLQGPSKVVLGLPFGDGVRCVSGSLKRLYSRVATGGVLTVPAAGEPSIRTRSAALGDPIPSPGTRYYQVWYRDGPGHFNITSALQIDWP